AGAAVVAGGPPAVGQADLGERVLPVLPQEILVEAGRDVVPRQDLVLGAVPVDVPVDVEAVVGHGLEPQVEAEVLAPLLDRAAAAPRLLDHGAEASVAARRQTLDEAGLGVVPGELDTLGLAGAVAQQRDLALQLLGRVLAEPLERREWLGDEAADR